MDVNDMGHIRMATPWTPFTTPQEMDQDMYTRMVAGLPQVTRRDASVLINGLDLFTIAGGPVIIDYLALECVTANDATSSTIQFRVTPTTGAAQTISAASLSIASATAGATVTLAGTALTTAALYNANGPNLIANPGTILAPIGVIDLVVGVGSTTGTWRAFLRWIPLHEEATVTAA